MEIYSINDFLFKEFKVRQLKNKRYSLRKFSYDLGISPAVMSRIFNKKLVVTGRTFEKIQARLQLPDELVSTKPSKVLKKVAKESRVIYLTKEELLIFKNWAFSAVLQILTLPSFKQDAEWVSKNLGLNIDYVNQCIDVLTRNHFIDLDKSGRWKILKENFSTLSIAPTSDELKNLQLGFFEKTTEAIEKVDIKYRDHSTMVLSLDSKDIPFVKERIKNFRRNLADQLEKKSGKVTNSVYQFSIGLSPFYIDQTESLKN